MQDDLSQLEKLAPADLDAGLLFSGEPSGRIIKGYSAPCAYTPKTELNYVFQESVRDIIVWLLNPDDSLYIYGPVGCGKSTCVRQLAARLNYPVFEVTAHGRLEFGDLIGHLTVRNGDMSFEYGPLALAMRYGAIFLLNEIDLTQPDVAAGLNGILDGAPLCIAENGGELIMPNPMFRFVATANTNGGGDETGLYQGTQRQNIAFADRFVLCEMTYPDAEVEKRLLQESAPGLPRIVRDTMVSFANEVRKLFMGEADALGNALEITFSTRSLLRWAKLTLRYQPLAKQGIQPISYALDRALAFRASRESRAMLHELAQRMFPENQQDISLEAFEADEADLGGENGVQFLKAKIRTMPADGSATVHLRKNWESPVGPGMKDWICAASPAGVAISYGRPGQICKPLLYNIDDCLNGSPLEELLQRSIRKLRENYRLMLPLCDF